MNVVFVCLDTVAPRSLACEPVFVIVIFRLEITMLRHLAKKDSISENLAKSLLGLMMAGEEASVQMKLTNHDCAGYAEAMHSIYKPSIAGSDSYNNPHHDGS